MCGGLLCLLVIVIAIITLCVRYGLHSSVDTDTATAVVCTNRDAIDNPVYMTSDEWNDFNDGSTPRPAVYFVPKEKSSNDSRDNGYATVDDNFKTTSFDLNKGGSSDIRLHATVRQN